MMKMMNTSFLSVVFVFSILKFVEEFRKEEKTIFYTKKENTYTCKLCANCTGKAPLNFNFCFESRHKKMKVYI